MTQPSYKVGLEIHGYIAEQTKLFCDCPIDEQAKPNTTICPVCTGQPGSKPMHTNALALEKAINISLMLGCRINTRLLFQRKHYSWPDSPNNYQKTMSGSYAHPVGEDGSFEGIGILQAHLEEDPARWDPVTGAIDYNRCGYPLIEIVTAPDFSNSTQVRAWLEKLVTTLSYIKALNRSGGIKCDVNVSIAPLYERVEIKNVNSFQSIVEAIEYEVARQAQEKTLGNAIPAQTRTWDDEKKQTIFMRTKESAADYMFIPEPDLPVIEISESYLTQLRSKLPDTPSAKILKLQSLGLKDEDAQVISAHYPLIDAFEKLVTQGISIKTLSQYLRREAISVATYNKLDIDSLRLDMTELSTVFSLLESGKITDKSAKHIIEKILISPLDVQAYVNAQGLLAMSDTHALKSICQTVIATQQKAVADYRAGNSASINFLVGQVMKQTKGTAKVDVVLPLMQELLK
jgi:aspartyl-tRNA(Asn)/glutamyl-tRNA(Gln) amidotransferase subunit B